MKKFSIIITAVIIAIILVGLKPGLKPTTYPLPVNLTYYWGDGCPHCKIVEDFLSTWGKNLPAGRQGLKIDKKEVWSNVANAKELEARYTFCQITNPQEMGVPLLFTPEGKCYSGDQPIIDYFKSIK